MFRWMIGLAALAFIWLLWHPLKPQAPLPSTTPTYVVVHPEVLSIYVNQWDLMTNATFLARMMAHPGNVDTQRQEKARYVQQLQDEIHHMVSFQQPAHPSFAAWTQDLVLDRAMGRALPLQSDFVLQRLLEASYQFLDGMISPEAYRVTIQSPLETRTPSPTFRKRWFRWGQSKRHAIAQTRRALEMHPALGILFPDHFEDLVHQAIQCGYWPWDTYGQLFNGLFLVYYAHVYVPNPHVLAHVEYVVVLARQVRQELPAVPCELLYEAIRIQFEARSVSRQSLPGGSGISSVVQLASPTRLGQVRSQAQVVARQQVQALRRQQSGFWWWPQEGQGRLENAKRVMAAHQAQNAANAKALLAMQGQEASVDSEEVLCSICREGIRPEEDVPKIACKHAFHRDCLRQWNKDCPLCGGDITESWLA